MTDELVYQILCAVEEIPAGKVAAYGQIAALIDRPKNARLVGNVLKNSSLYGNYPCHRVVNSAGRLCPGWPEQAVLLKEEGVALLPDGRVDMKVYQWRPQDVL